MTATDVRASPRKPAAAAAKDSFRPDIQGMRALAVTLVLAAHIFHIPSGGFIGVDVFFVVSGFVIARLLLRERDRTGGISLRGFYRRRARRILPASALVITATCAIAFVLFPADRARSTWWDAVAAALGVSNWRFAATETDYFAQALPPSPLQHFWSLSVEEQFYILLPLALILGTILVRSRRSATTGVVALITVASFAWSVLDSVALPESAYFSSLSRFWELGVGVLLALATPWLGRIPAFIRPVLLYAGIAMILVAAFTLTPESTFPGVNALPPVIGAAIALAAGTGARSGYGRVAAPLTNPVAGYLGDRSYSIYLWHWPLVVFAPSIVASGWASGVGILVATLILSELTYRWVETPVRRSTWLETRSDLLRGPEGRASAIVLAMLVVLASTAVIATREPATATPPASRGVALHPPTPPAAGRIDCPGAVSLQLPTDSCERATGVVPARDTIASDDGGAFTAECWRNRDDAPASCTFGSSSPDATRVALIGDSHAAMYIPVLRELAPELNWTISTYVGWGCQWAPHEGEPCEEQSNLAQARLIGDSPYDLVLTASSRKAMNDWDDATVDRAAAMWQAAVDAGSRVVVLESVPIPAVGSIDCAQRIDLDPGTDRCDTGLAEAFTMPDTLSRIADLTPSAHVATVDLLCDDAGCPAITGGTRVYRDADGHLTATYLRTMTPYLAERLNAALVSE
ncbi:acyltransferase family protein [Microbacterium sp. M3]|uniref:Acyltransferase family protein n=1 Tax=Microbacterium arthrosphaerae TaxID=792652 RepID=A0ABU4H1Z2_9MICO|nr:MULTISPECIES: acyltransferase family protein [Microbacterium]MDW4573358.1 acyltransferase family protein [Microbacterium arthrosphaerae]MDW7607213.1 acyltransferase family protein [Microbacterium sp. M3]